MHFTKEEFEETKLKAEQQYRLITEAYCPYLNEKVLFNSEGLEHLNFKDDKHQRSEDDQLTRLKLLHLAPEILKRSHTLQGIESGNKMQRIKIRNKWETRMVFVTYYVFIAVIEYRRIKIIVKRINHSAPYFWSIIPYWKQSNHKRKLFDRNPETE
jgi:hypothetical protein